MKIAKAFAVTLRNIIIYMFDDNRTGIITRAQAIGHGHGS